MRKNLFVLTIFLSLLVPMSLQAEEVRVTAAVNKRAVTVGEEVRLSIRVTGQSMNLQAPRLPKLDGIDTYYTGRASHITFINGVSTSNVEFSYTLIPQRPGNYHLNAIEVSVGPKVFQTEPIAIDVTGSQAPSAVPAAAVNSQQPMPSSMPQNVPQEPPVVSSGGDNNIFVQAWVDRRSVYQNEQLLLTYSLFTRYDTRYEGFEKEAETSGFWIEEFPMEREIERETVQVNGRRFVKADVKKLALFPTSPGSYTIQPGSLKVSIREEPQGASAFDEFFSDSFFTGGSFFARRQNRLLNPPPIQLTVKPLPDEGKPEGFQGAVGSFRLTASLDKDKVKQSEPVTLKLVIEGEGNIETINRPKLPTLTGFKTYDADTNAKLFKTGNVIGGTKSFEIVFIPKEEGSAFIPPLEFSYFDPRKAAYVTLRTPNFPITVEHSDQSFQMPEELTGKEMFQKNVKLEAKDIRYIQERVSESSALFDRIYRGFAWGDLFLLVVFAALWLKDRQERLFSKDEGLRRRKMARAVASANMRKLKKRSSSSKPEDVGLFFEELERAMTQYIADKWNLSAYGVTRQSLEEVLANHFGPEDPHLKDVLELYSLCDESRFGKGSIPQASKKVGMRIFQETVNRIERMKR